MNRTALTVLALMSSAGAAHALTVDEIVAKHIEARGGEAKLAALKSVRFTGKAVFGGGDFAVTTRFAQVIARPGSIRSEITLQGLTAVDAFDGKEAWSTQPFQGRREAQRGTADDVRAKAQDADLEGPLVHWKEKGHRVESLGTEDVDGTEALKLRVRRKDGDTLYVYLDPDYFLEIRELSIRHARGVERVSETDFGSYQRVAGVWFPFSTESGAKGGPRGAHFTIETAEANVAADDSLFHFPSPGTPVAAAIAAPEHPTLEPSPAPSATDHAPKFGANVISGLGARNIGSAAMSGRVAALDGRVAGGKTTLYVGAASGGVWKSIDDGTTFKPVFDKQPVQSIGAVAIDPSDPKTVWVGTGEAWTRNSVSVGNGIYKSTDEGDTWTNMGLPNSERIARILIHPKNSAVVYACVPGKLWSDSPDRGLYKTTDGGATWTLVLPGKNLSTGCSGLSMDPKNPDVLFAGMWDFRRKGWTFRSGGDGPDAPSASGLFRTQDGGKTWVELTAKSRKGLPQGPWGRVEVVVAPSNAKIVYALIESKASALYRSSDGGATWEARDNSQMMVWRPFYFGHLVVDPKNAERVFKPDGNLIVSDDGGRSFQYAGGGSHGDWHDLWIDPTNPTHIVGGDDGGLWLSRDGGNRWWKADNLPISQFYHVSVDDKDPYQVYGGLQDNSSWVGDSSYSGGVTSSRWENLWNSDGFWVVVDPSDPDSVYAEGQGGFIARIDRRTKVARDVQPKAGYHEKLRFNWNTPIAASPTDKKTLYIGAQFLFRSRDRGDNWERISPDLSTNDPQKQRQEESGGVTVDNSAAEMHTSIYSISESPKDSQVVWVGTDDGNLQLTRDSGKSWVNVVKNVKDLPPASWVSWVEASRFDPGTAYAAFDRHSFGDMTPWVYRTTDFGKSWTRLVGPDQGVRGYAHVVKEDTVKPGLLFVGTEFGLWISIDAGKSWAEFKGGNFPSVAVRDLQIHPRDGDLVLATHGRGIWIVDDLTPLRALTPEVMAKDAVFMPGGKVQQRMYTQGGWANGDAAFVGENPPSGAEVTYYQRSRHLFGPIQLEVLDASGKVVDTLSATKRSGLNRVSWLMQVKPPRVPRAATVAFAGSQGPRVPPGRYTFRLTRGTQVTETAVDIGLDRRAPYDVAGKKEQFDAAMRVHGLFGEMSALMDRIQAAQAAVAARSKGVDAADALGKKLHDAADELDGMRKKIVATKEGGAITGEERIREHTDTLYRALLIWEGRPAKYQLERIDVLKRELGDVKSDFEGDMKQLNDALKERKQEPVPTTVGALAPEEGRDGETMTAERLECIESHGASCRSESRAAAE